MSLFLRAVRQPQLVRRYLLSPAQALAVQELVASTVAASSARLTSQLVTRDLLGHATADQLSRFADLKALIVANDNLDFNAILTQQAHLKREIETLKNEIRFKIADNANKVRADLALEKGRVKQEGSTHTRQIQNAYNLIDQEVTDMRAEIGNVRTVVTQWLIGTLCAAIALVFAYLRLIV